MSSPGSGPRGEDNTEIGVFSRPHPGFSENGDAYLVHRDGENGVLVAVVDGLGHGPAAAEAAQTAIGFVASHASDELDHLLRRCHHRLRGSRGAAVALARIDGTGGQLSYGGVGNIEARLIGHTSARPISYNGIVGAILPNFRVFELSFQPDDLFLLHTDGISARFDLTGYPDLSGQPAQLIAEAIARDWARTHDDATIIVVRHAGDNV